MTTEGLFKENQHATRIMIVDDHPALCEGLGHRIAAQPDLTVCGQAADVDEALAKIEELHPELVIVDIALKNSDGLELIKSVDKRYKHVRMLVHSMYEEAIYADRCLHAGAMGYLNKEADPNEVIKAIREIRDGRVYVSAAMTREIVSRTVKGGEPRADPMDTLTDRQLEIFRLLGEGYDSHQLAERLSISVHTVDTHRDNIKRKLKIDSASELNRRAVLWVAEQR
jgi:DNA-binding NarL/FixJ family response regulator